MGRTISAQNRLEGIKCTKEYSTELTLSTYISTVFKRVNAKNSIIDRYCLARILKCTKTVKLIDIGAKFFMKSHLDSYSPQFDDFA